jgi:hypothetical protein
VRDFQFYHAGCQEPKGLRRVVVPFRRLLRRLLRPIFQRQAELLAELSREQGRLAQRQEQLTGQLENLTRRLEQLDRQVQAATAFGWDYVALVRRLAALEDHVTALLQAGPAPEGKTGSPARAGAEAGGRSPMAPWNKAG